MCLKLSDFANDAAPCKAFETYLSHLHAFNFVHHLSSSSSIVTQMSTNFSKLASKRFKLHGNFAKL